MNTPLHKNLWYEKYRPRKFKDIILIRKDKEFFKKCIRRKNIPHLLFAGPAGTGKTTLALILIDKCASAKLILNASSSDRGIATIKEKVKNFARSVSTGDGMNIVLFDEADGLTADAQLALKNTIEQYSTNCRFIFTANTLGKIIDPIVSRCMMFNFTTKQFGRKDLLNYLQDILKKEGVAYKRKHLKEVIEFFSPDVRSIMNHLQYACATGTLKSEVVSRFSNAESLSMYLEKGMISAIRGTLLVGQTEFTWLYRWLFDNLIPELDEEIQSDSAIVVAEYLHRDAIVADKEINASACLIELMSIMGTELNFKDAF